MSEKPEDVNNFHRNRGDDAARKKFDHGISSVGGNGVGTDGAGQAESVKSAAGLHWHGEKAGVTRDWLVDQILPEIGTALFPGPWGSYKTFVVVDLAMAVMLQRPFAGRAVKQRCGVLFVAAEGAFEIPLRLQAAFEESPSYEEGKLLPFAWIETCPRLLDRIALRTLEAMSKEADRKMQSEHGVSLGLIIIDTMAAAAGFNDENSNAETQAVMNVVTALAKSTKTLVGIVDHFGKSSEVGTRGGSAKEASADAVLAVLADRDVSGKTSNARVLVRKVRGAPQGAEIPFTPKLVDLGFDQNGNPVGTLTIVWGQEKASAGATAGQPVWPKHLQIFHQALTEALISDGKELRLGVDGPVVKAVDRERVRAEFYRIYPVEGDTEDKKQEARRKAYNRKFNDAQERRLIGVWVDGKRTDVWLVARGPAADSRGSNYKAESDTRDASLGDVPCPGAPEGMKRSNGTDVPSGTVPPVPPVTTATSTQLAPEMHAPQESNFDPDLNSSPGWLRGQSKDALPYDEEVEL
jgi:hypothetical protein